MQIIELETMHACFISYFLALTSYGTRTIIFSRNESWICLLGVNHFWWAMVRKADWTSELCLFCVCDGSALNLYGDRVLLRCRSYCISSVGENSNGPFKWPRLKPVFDNSIWAGYERNKVRPKHCAKEK